MRNQTDYEVWNSYLLKSRFAIVVEFFSCNIMNDDYLAFLSFRKQAAFASKARQSLPCLSGAKVAYYLMQGKYIKEIFL